ncbi:hypothetical protein BJ875DRAFT_93411 [Amylocarpus encephaloides]|uniref:HTH La-type RNA-binding domain-containing protein n=1 Tax=Amylocarpus encephaloides TaxID=45428 RepID=A0A9P8C4M4_9HELO|nr:hypothetical protein BJ875DRAFT_93411 [Amylocarpus encephaloides]
MSSTASRSTGEATPTPPVFSYAQAAKGRASAAAVGSSVTSNQATSGVSTPAKGTSSMTNTPSGGSERGDQSVNGSIDTPGKADQSVETNSESKGTTSTKSSSRPGSPSFGASSISTLPKEENHDVTPMGGYVVESNRERHAHGTEKGNEGSDGRKSKKGRKAKNAEKEAAELEKAQQEEAKSQELFVPAPLPAVNFWNKRKEEAAKTKPAPVVASGPQAAAEPALVNDSPRSPDAKRRNKVNGVDDGGKSVGATQNGAIKDSPNTIRAQKKVNEASQKTREEQAPKRSGPRGGRVGEKEEKSPVSRLPPPVEDAISWPTPETALEEEKRRAQEKLEKEERDESTSNKPRPKKEWQTMPYVPSVNFNTPLPSRGGRGRGGARTGGRTENAGGGRTSHANNASTPGDKGQNVSATTVSNPTENDKRVSRGDAPRAASLPPNSNKRHASDPSTARDQRKASATNQADKPRGASKVDSSNISDIRNTSYAEHEGNFDPNNAHNLSQIFRSDQMQSVSQDTHAHPRSGADRRSEPGARGFEQAKDNGPNSREGRADRGRGGYRGRGSHNFQNGQQHPSNIYTNGHGPQQTNGYPVRQGSGPYSPPLQGAPFNNHYPIPPSRGGRGGSRSQSIPNSAPMYSRFPTNGGPGAHMPPLQTANMYEYQQPLQSMSAMPFNSYMDHVSILAMVKMQLEYYFSIDNLCKDVFLRKHMDSQGFVFLTFIASFKRIQALTQDFDLLYTACQESEIIDQIRGEDGVDRLRRKEGWEKWVLPIDDRDESVRNAGPQYHHSHHAPRLGHIALSGHQSLSPPPFSPIGTEASFRPFGNSVPTTPHLNGNGHAYHPETPLSAAVPDFAPGLMAVNGTNDPLEAENTFSDEEIANLTLVFAPPKPMDETQPKTPYHTAASRTFSNGSIDGRSVAEEIQDDTRQGRTLTNGSRVPEAPPESLRRSRSPQTALSPTGSTASNAPPVMWVKGQRQQAPVSEHNSRESYTSFRARALNRRGASATGETHADMKLLYEFWSHFLCRNFNLTMYSEFRQYAYEDAESKAMSGMKNLVSYYDEILNSKKKVIPETLARHYVDLVKEEDAEDRPAFERLRAAWRNGALDMKSRKKIDNFVDQELRGELEQAPKQKSDLS